MGCFKPEQCLASEFLAFPILCFGYLIAYITCKEYDITEYDGRRLWVLIVNTEKYTLKIPLSFSKYLAGVCD